MSAPIHDVAIIGSGLAGLTLALALHQQNIPSTLYESRPAPLNIGGAVMLSPNALRVLDALGLYAAVRARGYNFDHLEYRDQEGEFVTERYEFGGEAKYGYRGLRIYRYELIDVLVEALAQRGVEVRYGRKFSHVVEDSPAGVTWAFDDGSVQSASVLVGADGIHSSVRKHMYPDLKPRFTNMAGITAAVPRAQLNLPPGYHLPVTIVSPSQGAFVIAPQRVDGSEVLIGKQQRLAEGEVPGWDRFFVADKEGGVKFLQQGNEGFPQMVRDAVSSIDPRKVNKWPFFVVPRLESWTSPTRRVVIVGDAAHAIPPSAGQGINQAFEDVYMLALVLGHRQNIVDMAAALAFWQSSRQDRVDRILELNKQIDLRRMPADDQGSRYEREEFDLGWLYNPQFVADVNNWVLYGQ
jgi:2-polyprenyl-6-methoxyphenol hydroxylase-like FAD-dependent oxidoreductase